MNKLKKTGQLLGLTKTILKSCRSISSSTWTVNRKLHSDKQLRNSFVAPQEASEVNNDAFEFHGTWPEEEKQRFLKDLRLVTSFISVDEEEKLLEEIEPYMQRLHYEFDHWDDAIHGFRETERKHWYPHNRAVLERVRQLAFDGEIMPYIHILDLAEQGVIKPHVDSTRYCGHTIAGMSLLSQSVMRLVRVDEHKFDKAAQNSTPNETNDNYRSQPKASLENNFYVDVLLPQRSLYIMSHSSRFNFTHEILSNDVATFKAQPIKKKRRISIICRNEP